MIERRVPVSALGVESTRERTALTPFPARDRFHVRDHVDRWRSLHAAVPVSIRPLASWRVRSSRSTTLPSQSRIIGELTLSL